MRRSNWLCCALPLLLATRLMADEVRLRCIADTNLSSYETEQDYNYGQSTRLRLKGVQMLALFRFDTTPIVDTAPILEIRKATLYLRYAGADRKLRTLGFSTVSAPWREGTGAAEKKVGEPCFTWRAYGQTRWAGPDSDFTDVSFTAGNTLANYGDVRDVGNGWIAVPIDPRLVQAQIAGLSYGLAVSDEKGQTGANNDVFSREQSGSEPYLIVEGEPPVLTQPQAVERPVAEPDSRHADFTSGALRLTWTTPPGAFGFEIRYGLPEAFLRNTSYNTPRYAIPYARPGERQTAILTGLKPGAAQVVEIVPISALGVQGSAVRITGIASPAKPEPAALQRPARPPAVVAKPASAGMRVWAYPDTEKANPVSGNLLEEVGLKRYTGPPAGTYREANSVWDGRAIHLFATRNEFVGCQLLIEATGGALHGTTVHAPTRFDGGDALAAWKPRTSLYRDWYIYDSAWFPEVCVPLTTPFDIPAGDNAVPHQSNQSLSFEMLVPRNVTPGRYHATFTVAADGQAPICVPVEIVVNSLTLPDTLSFDISLNAYGTLGAPFGLDDHTPEYRALEREYHRMAHLHRATLAILGYSHSGNISTHYAPTLAGEGADRHVTDWTDWDAQFGPYLDGSAFTDLPRKGVPITHLYLPFHEDWPEDMRTHYRYHPTNTDYPATIVEHALTAPPIEQALDSDFANGFTSVVRQFAAHLREKGWNHTNFQFYQNDKYYYKDPKTTSGRGTSWWLLDEPNHRDDWLALAYFDRLFRLGMKDYPDVPMIAREDISRPQWQRNMLDGLVGLMVVSGELYTKGPRLREMQERWGVRLWNYGAANAVQRSNTEVEAWAVRAWLAGADGIVPWQTIGTDENYIRADETALLLPGKRFGIQGPVASLRLKALRRAQQDAEYLVLLARARHWDRAQVAAAMRGIVTTAGSFDQRGPEDAGRYTFAATRAADLEAMRRAAADATR